MKITDIKTWVVANPPPHFGGRYFILVKLTASNGIEGVGEVYAATFGPHVIARMVEDVFARFVAGADPFKIETLWRRVYGSGYNLRPDVSLLGVLSGIETACWDIIGKAVDKPVHELLGGRVHERLRSYTYLYPDAGDPGGVDGDAVYTDPDLAAARAAEYVALGFTAVKFDPAGAYSAFDPRQPGLQDLDRSARFVKQIRDAVGARADILFGTHGQFTAAGAIRLARRIEAYEPLWFEEPTPPDNPREMARVARQTSIPIAAGERLTTKYEFARVLEHQSAAILQPALGRVGGILEAKKIAGMSEAHHAQIAPHLYCGPIEGAANIQLAACSPNFLILEGIQTWGDFYADLLKQPVQWEAGYVIPPTAPGLGVELNETVADANPYTGDELHLEMNSESLQ